MKKKYIMLIHIALTFFLLCFILSFFIAFKNYNLEELFFQSNQTLPFLLGIIAFLLIIYIYLHANHNKLKEAVKKSQEVNKVKSEFIARMSHDMRTPLNAVIGMANFGLEEFENETSFSYFSEIKGAAEYLLSLMDDILDMQKIESGKIELEANILKIGTMQRQTFNIVKQRALQKNIIFTCSCKNKDVTPYVILDVRRTQQIVINLLNNAIKYTQRGGFVKWNMSFSQHGKHTFIVTHEIEDNGLGMSDEFQKHMFETFTQEYSSLSKEESGTGLGLSIIKRLVELMGGSIRCKSHLGVGTKFKVSLPYKVPSLEEIALYEEDRLKKCDYSILKGKKILVCEDIEVNARIVQNILMKAGIESDWVLDGAKGVEAAHNDVYDAILMDIRMPVMNGLEATQCIRKFNTSVPIIALSANAYADDIKNSLNAGMNMHLSKPISKEALYESLFELFA